MSKPSVLRAIAGPGYVVAALLVILPLADYVSNVTPVQLGVPTWRYGAVGLFSGFMLTPLLGLVLAVAIAVVADHRLALRVFAIASAVVTVLIVCACVLFALDVIQIRSNVKPEATTRFDTGAVRAFVKYVLLLIPLGWFGWVGIKATRHGHGEHGHREPSIPLVGRPSQPGA